MNKSQQFNLVSRIAELLGNEWSIVIEKNNPEFYRIAGPGYQMLGVDFFCHIISSSMPEFGKDFVLPLDVIECDLTFSPESIANEIKTRLLPGYAEILEAAEKEYNLIQGLKSGKLVFTSCIA